ncbi:MAG TPA: HNH endonuclease domain-containing protein [Halomicronema sp.]
MSSRTISTILKHDTKVTSYKMALLRSINDIALSFPDLGNSAKDVAIPLRVLAEFWLAYYWPFVDNRNPILQGYCSKDNGKLRNDMSFRPQLTALRQEWENIFGNSKACDGFFLINEMRIPRKKNLYSHQLLNAYRKAIIAISQALQMPIKHAGPGQWSVFPKPLYYKEIEGNIIAVPSTLLTDKCLLIKADLWKTFQEMSLWIEALSIHEWSIFTENVQKNVNRGDIYSLLTERLDNRRPLTWERNNIDLLLIEGIEFVCPWTQQKIRSDTPYDLDHLLPISIYPINELWNLVPANPKFNSHIKRDKLPSPKRLEEAKPHIELAYKHYQNSKALSIALQEDTAVRFTIMQGVLVPYQLTQLVTQFIQTVADFRNLPQF